MPIIDTLLVAGCSHSFGAETVSEEDHSHPDSINFSYGKYLAELLGIKNYKNISVCGISNLEINNKVIQYFLKEKNNLNSTLCVIGWTDSNRFTFYPKNILNKLKFMPSIFNQPYNFSSYMFRHNTVYNKQTYLQHITSKHGGEEFLSFFDRYIFNTPNFYDLNYNARLCTTHFLANRHIKHLSFPTVSIKIYDNTFMYERCLDNGVNILEHKNNFTLLHNFKQYGFYKGGHLKTEGHQAFAKFLLEELKARNIL